METYFQKGEQEAGALEQDDRLPPAIPCACLAPGQKPLDNQVVDRTPIFGTESCVGCHYSAGSCIDFGRDIEALAKDPATGRLVPAKYSTNQIIKGVFVDVNGNFKDLQGYARDKNFGRRIPIYGENSHGGNTGNGEFSWLLQIEAKSKSDPTLTKSVNKNAAFIAIHPANQQ
jgi:hypothetical protein